MIQLQGSNKNLVFLSYFDHLQFFVSRYKLFKIGLGFLGVTVRIQKCNA